jgi:hypothetical protein
VVDKIANAQLPEQYKKQGDAESQADPMKPLHP